MSLVGLAAGQVSGLIKSVKPAGDIVQDIVAETTSMLAKVSKRL